MAQNNELANLLVGIIQHEPETFLKVAVNESKFNQIRMKRIFNKIGVDFDQYKNKIKYEEALDYASK